VAAGSAYGTDNSATFTNNGTVNGSVAISNLDVTNDGTIN
jgi:hypothetical protein